MKRIVIVGASSGIGRLIAEYFASKGWKTAVAARNEKALCELKAEYGQNIEWEKIDVNAPDAPDKLLALIERNGGMDIYLHVSGICIENPELNVGHDISIVETNVGGFTRMIDTAFNYFRDRRLKGRIAAITSIAGTKGLADLAAYSASKRYQWTYLVALEQLAHREKLPIRFTDIRPGWTRTPLIDPSRRYLMAMNPNRVAKRAARAIIAGRRMVVINRRWACAQILWRIVPSWIWVRIPMRASY